VKPPDSTPDRPRDIIDDVEDICGQSGSVAEIGPEYCESLLALGLKQSGDREQLEDIARDVAAALKGLPQEAPELDEP